MSRKVPDMTTDEAAERFLQEDLSDLDFSQFKRGQFEFESKDAQISMRLPRNLLTAIKMQAKARGIPYQRYIREVLEHEIEGTDSEDSR